MEDGRRTDAEQLSPSFTALSTGPSIRSSIARILRPGVESVREMITAYILQDGAGATATRSAPWSPDRGSGGPSPTPRECVRATHGVKTVCKSGENTVNIERSNTPGVLKRRTTG